MTSRANRRCLTVLVLASVFIGSAAAQTSGRELVAEKVFSKDTVFLLCLPDVTATRERWQTTALHDLFQDPELRGMFAPLKRQWQALAPVLLVALPAPLEQFGALVDGEVALGVVLRRGPEGPQGVLHVVLRPRNPESAMAAWNMIVGGSKLRRMIQEEVKADDGSMRYTFRDDGVLAVSIEEGVWVLTFTEKARLDSFHAEAVGRLKGNSAELPGSANYAASMKKLGPHTGARFYANLSLLTSVVGDANPEAKQFLESTGLVEMRSLAACGSFQENGIRLSACLLVPRPKASLTATPIGEEDLARVPAGVRSFHVGNVDLQAVYDLAVKLASVATGRDMSRFEGLKQFESAVGLKIRDEVLALFGNRFVTYSPSSEGPAGGGRVVFIKVHDDQLAVSAVERVIRGLAQVIGPQLQMSADSVARVGKIERDGFVHVYPSSALPTRFAPHFAIGKGWMCLGLSARTVRSAMERFLNPAKDVRANPDFAALLARMPAEYTGIGYTDTPAFAGNFVEWLQLIGDIGHAAVKVRLARQTQGIARMLLSGGPWLDGGRFPSEARLREKLFGHVSVTQRDEEGLRYESFSSCGPIPSVGRPDLGMSGPQVAIVAGMLLPALSRARQEARKASCKSNLRQIGIALIAYSADHGDQRPASLADLVPGHIEQRGVFRCPSDKAGIPQIRGGIPCSYCYVGSIPAKEGFADLIVACSRFGVHRGGRNVLHYDGRVQWMPEVDFKAKLGRQAKDFWQPLMQRNPAGVDKARVKAFLAGQLYDEGKE